jgi:hypothetical protein
LNSQPKAYLLPFTYAYGGRFNEITAAECFMERYYQLKLVVKEKVRKYPSEI